MKRALLVVLVLLLSVSLIGCLSQGAEAQSEKEGQQKEETQQGNELDEKAVASLVEGFGSKLQTVSLLAPKDILEKSMQENYSDFVSQELLAKWINDPLNAPGRLTSSPWPDRIEILTIEKSAKYEYEVKGKIIEVTSTEKASGGIAAKRPITLIVRKINDRWLIDDVTLGAYE